MTFMAHTTGCESELPQKQYEIAICQLSGPDPGGAHTQIFSQICSNLLREVALFAKSVFVP